MLCLSFCIRHAFFKMLSTWGSVQRQSGGENNEVIALPCTTCMFVCTHTCLYLHEHIHENRKTVEVGLSRTGGEWEEEALQEKAEGQRRVVGVGE